MKYGLFYLALVGWVASFTVHMSAVSGYNVAKEFPFVMALHVGIFVVWIPMVWYLKKDEDYKQFERSGLRSRSNPFNLFKVLFKNTPPLLKVLAIVGFVYTPLNFFLAARGNVEEMNTARMFSGHWMGFYGIAMAALYPFHRQTDAVM